MENVIWSAIVSNSLLSTQYWDWQYVEIDTLLCNTLQHPSGANGIELRWREQTISKDTENDLSLCLKPTIQMFLKFSTLDLITYHETECVFLWWSELIRGDKGLREIILWKCLNFFGNSIELIEQESMKEKRIWFNFWSYSSMFHCNLTVFHWVWKAYPSFFCT